MGSCGRITGWLVAAFPMRAWKTLIQGGRLGARAGPNAAAIGSPGSSSGPSGKWAAGIPQGQIANQQFERPPETCAQGREPPHEPQARSGAALGARVLTLTGVRDRLPRSGRG